MSELVKDKSLVIPGEALFEGMDYLPGPGTYRNDKKIVSKYLGVAEFKNNRLVRVIPLKGKYIPRENDFVIGYISRVSHAIWQVDLNSPYEGILPLSEGTEEFIDLNEKSLEDFYDIDDTIVVKIKKVTQTKDVQLTMKDRRAKKLIGGRIIEISHTKVPRLIGKSGTMVGTIKDKTGCVIIVGQNGRVWLKGNNEELAVRAIKKVEAEAHTSGLTDKITHWLDEESKKVK